VIVTDEAVSAAVRLSARYISGRQLPDKAVDLLDTCCARVKVALQQKPAAIDDIEILIANLTREVESLERDRDKGVKIDMEHLGEVKTKITRAEEDLAETKTLYEKETEGAKRIVEMRKKMDESKTDEERDAARKEVVTAIQELHAVQKEVPLIRPDVD